MKSGRYLFPATGILWAAAMLCAASGIKGQGKDCFPHCRRGYFCADGTCLPDSNRNGAKPRPSAENPPIDQPSIHQLYTEGEFAAVSDSLETFIRRNASYSRADSIFIAKHLAVVYSANPDHREKGKYYMDRLLDLLPSAQLVDMYVSEEIDRLFEKVKRDRYLRGERIHAAADSATPVSPSAAVATPPVAAVTAPKPSDRRPPVPEKPGHRKLLIWTTVGTVAAGGIVAGYLLLPGKPEAHVYDVDARTN